MSSTSRSIIVVGLVVVGGTLYSVRHGTYLDTSDPLLTHLAHPLSQSHYFANKANLLNVFFLKKAWAWTTIAFMLLYGTSPAQLKSQERIAKYLTLTGLWILFTSWFFGPALLERFIVLSGGQCVIPLPGDEQGTILQLPTEFCYTRKPVTAATVASHPELFVSGFFQRQDALSETLRIVPRLRSGHDVSGHVFLLTVATLFLIDQLRWSFKGRSYVRWNSLHSWAVAINLLLVGLWVFALWTTSVYFHSPLEKVTGLRKSFPLLVCRSDQIMMPFVISVGHSRILGNQAPALAPTLLPFTHSR